MSGGINSFDVLKRMSELNRDIRLSPIGNVTHLKKVQAGTQVTIGVAGDVVGAIHAGELVGGLLLWDKEQFEATKLEMMKELKVAGEAK